VPADAGPDPSAPGLDLEAARRRAARVNRDLWAVVNEEYTDGQAVEKWALDEMRWGIFDIPESELGVLGDVVGLDVVELGCGTAYVSAILAKAGARPVGVDVSADQLATARRCQESFGPTFPLVNADATAVPLANGRFDLAISEYGASLWCDADGWIGEAARLLRPGGRLVFLTSSPLVSMCVPQDEGVATRELQRGQRDIDPITWPGGGIEFHPGHGEMIRVLRRHGFVVEELRELFAPEHAETHVYYQIADPEWARSWPVEDLWVARLSTRPH
jgi:SAM-dependent methyltransferase